MVTVCPHSVCLCCRGRTLDKHGALEVIFPLFLEVNRPTQWFRMVTQWLCVLKCVGGGEAPDHGALIVVFQVFLREIETHSGSVYTGSGCCL